MLVGLNPHDFISFGGSDTTSVGQNPIVGAWSIVDFKNKIYFPPRNGRKGNIKLPFSIRIRIDNPNFIAGTPNQEPYLYGEKSNILVFKPNLTNIMTGSTDSEGNSIVEPYFIGWDATPEDSVQ